jgi:hypothetical protein
VFFCIVNFSFPDPPEQRQQDPNHHQRGDGYQSRTWAGELAVSMEKAQIISPMMAARRISTTTTMAAIGTAS